MLLVLTSWFSLIFCLLARVYGWAPGWRLLFGTLLGWVSMVICTWRYLLTEGEKAYVHRKIRLLRERVSKKDG